MISRSPSSVALVDPSRRLRSRPSAGTRAGFTLLELLTVIVVIAILIGLLIPAVSGARTSARIAAVRTEMSGLDGALSAFHGKYRTMPPSFLDLRRNASGQFVNPATMSTLRGVFGTQISEAAMVGSLNAMDFPGEDVAGAGDYSKRGVLRGAECLVLFLGGLPASGAASGGNMVPTKELSGWSKNPRDPFNATSRSAGTFVLADPARRQPPFFEFDPDRLRYVNEVEDAGATPDASEPLLSYFTYVDSLDGQAAPLIFATSDGGRGYEPSHVIYNTGPFKNADGSASLSSGVYQTAGGGAINPRGYQLISPGNDTDYGAGGTYSKDGGYVPAGGAGNDGGADNITNFASSTLGDD